MITTLMSDVSRSGVEGRRAAAEREKAEAVPVNGPAAAALLAAGLGSATLGLMIVLVEASPRGFKNWLNFYDPVGPLSGKTIVAVAVYAISWIILGMALRGRNVRLERWVTATFVLIAVGILLTFPPIYQLFTRH
jgi:hypothetical protein